MGSTFCNEDSSESEERQRELRSSREIKSGGSALTSVFYGELQNSVTKTKSFKTNKELWSYKLASIKELVVASERKQEFSKTVMEVPKLLERLSEIKCIGKVTIEEGSNFGMIILDDAWQEVQEELIELLRVEEVACREEFIRQARSQANEWGYLLGLTKDQNGFFTPISLAGLHISLGKINEKEKPDCVVDGREVKFSITGFTTMPTMWALPKIYPAQKTKVMDKTVLMNCPTRWYFANVEVQNFDFPFKYPPHITLGCFGLINVPQAAIREMNKSLKETGSGCAEYEYGKS